MKISSLKGILYPAKMKTGSWIVVGPPGSGKTWLIDKIKGYPGEVGIDISENKWWSVEPLTHRPREIHFAMPFKGYQEPVSVYDDQWKGMTKFPQLDTERIIIPSKKKFILAPNWRARFVFDFILPPPRWLCGIRQKRLASDDMRLVDMDLTLEWVTWQVHTHWQLAWHFHQSGLQVMLRPFNTARPYSFPVMKKVLRKKPQASEKKVRPKMDWSKVRYVKLWCKEASPTEGECSKALAQADSDEQQSALSGEQQTASQPRPAIRSQPRPATRGQRRPAIRGQRRPAIHGQRRPAIRGQRRPAIHGQRRPTIRSQLWTAIRDEQQSAVSDEQQSALDKADG